MTDKIIRVKIEAGDSQQQINQLDSSMVKLGASTDKTTAEIAGLNTDLTKTAQGVKAAVGATNEAVGNLGRTTGQAAMQVQQLVGQVQGGVSPFVALSQQAADLGFVLGFPLLGAVVGIGAALAGPLVAAFTQAEESADKFKETLKEINNTQEEYKANAVRVEVAKLNDEFERQQQKVDSLKRQQEQYIELLKRGGSSQASYAVALFDVNRQIDNAVEAQADLSKKIEEVGAAGLSATAAADTQSGAIESLTSNLELQRIALEQGELQGRLYAAANQLELQSVEALPPAIREQITAIYELEQAQKAQKEAAQQLLQTQREVAQEVSQQARADADAARRAERDKQRINERIANMRLETQTMAAESELQRAVMEGRFSAEDAQAAERFASKVLQATTEYQTLLDLANQDKELQLQAEQVFQDRLAAIKQQYADQQDQITANSNYAQYQYAQQLQSIQMDTASNALSALSSFAKQGSGVQKALFLALKGVQAAQAYTSGLTAAMLARATIPYPASEPIALAQITAGKVSAAAIMATGIAGTFSGGGGSIGGGSIPSSAPTTMPTTPQAAATVNTLEIVGLTELKEELRNNEGMVSTRFVASILDKIEDANRLRGQA